MDNYKVRVRFWDHGIDGTQLKDMQRVCEEFTKWVELEPRDVTIYSISEFENTQSPALLKQEDIRILRSQPDHAGSTSNENLITGRRRYDSLPQVRDDKDLRFTDMRGWLKQMIDPTVVFTSQFYCCNLTPQETNNLGTSKTTNWMHLPMDSTMLIKVCCMLNIVC